MPGLFNYYFCLKIEPMTSYVLSICSTTEPHYMRCMYEILTFKCVKGVFLSIRIPQTFSLIKSALRVSENSFPGR